MHTLFYLNSTKNKIIKQGGVGNCDTNTKKVIPSEKVNVK